MIIEFKGHAKKAIKDEVELAAWFVKDELMPRHRKIYVTIHFMKNLRKNEGIHGDCLDEEDREYTIRVDSTQARKEIISTIIHEMVHVYQYVTGKMKQKWVHEVVFEKKVYPWDMEYQERPWEIEAHTFEKDLYAKFYKYM